MQNGPDVNPTAAFKAGRIAQPTSEVQCWGAGPYGVCQRGCFVVSTAVAGGAA